jgi:hypothetical protein
MGAIASGNLSLGLTTPLTPLKTGLLSGLFVFGAMVGSITGKRSLQKKETQTTSQFTHFTIIIVRWSYL